MRWVFNWKTYSCVGISGWALLACGDVASNENQTRALTLPGAPAAADNSAGAAAAPDQGTPAPASASPLDFGLGDPSVVASAAGSGSFEECVAEAQAAEDVGLDMYVVLDRSGSMNEGGPDGGGRNNRQGDCPLSLNAAPSNTSKWCLATHALAQYFGSDVAAKNRAGLQYMPLENPEDDPTVCTSGGGISQAEVPLSALPSAATDGLFLSLDANGPGGNGGTPIQAALNGIVNFTAANQQNNRVMIGIFITDGDPHFCEEDTTLLAPILANHLAATSIRTFVIGMTGATNENLEVLALAGGAPEHTDFCGDGPSPCHYWNVGDGDPAAFVSALEQIQQSATLPCNYVIPLPPGGQTLDIDLINVTYTDELGVAKPLGRVTDATACTGVADGWYYDNNVAPSTVLLCPTTCTAAEGAASGANVDISFGCATVLR